MKSHGKWLVLTLVTMWSSSPWWPSSPRSCYPRRSIRFNAQHPLPGNRYRGQLIYVNTAWVESHISRGIQEFSDSLT